MSFHVRPVNARRRDLLNAAALAYDGLLRQFVTYRDVSR